MEVELLPLYGELKTSFKSKLFLDIELSSYIVDTVTLEAALLLYFNVPFDDFFTVLEPPAFELGTLASLALLITSLLVGLFIFVILFEPSTWGIPMSTSILLEVEFGLKLLLASQSFLIRLKKSFIESSSDDNEETEILCCFLLIFGRLFNEGSAISLHKLSKIFELFELFWKSESSLSDDNILRGFFLVPIIELLSESTEIFESTLAIEGETPIDVTCPEVAVEEEVSCGDSVTPEVFVDMVPPAGAAGSGGGGGDFFDFFGKKEGTPFLFLLPDLKSSIEVVEGVFEFDKFDKFAELFVELPF